MAYYPAGLHKKKSHIDQEEIVQLEMVEDTNNIFDNDGGKEPSSSSEVTFHNLEQLAGTGLRKGNGGATASHSNANTGSHHQKHSTELNYRVPTPPPTPPPTRPAVVFASLRDVHQSSNSDGGTAVHQKYSVEKNGVNPDELPDYYGDLTLAPSSSPTPGPTVDIRRVNPAVSDSEDEDSERECRAKDGVYFGNGQNARSGSGSGGVVLRYQYELVQEWNNENETTSMVTTPMATGGDASGTQHLVTDILPNLEKGISDALIPVFFQECLTFARGEGRGLMREVEAEAESRQQNNRPRLRHRRLSQVIGIDAAPDDFPLSQECESNYSSPQATHCHRMEGALTLYFPPNYSLSTLLSSTTLSTLRAIEGGMTDGSLKLAHGDIRKLRFLSSSYELHPSSEVHQKDVGPDVFDDGSPQGQGSNAGLILGIIIPLLVVGCCLFGLFLWKRRQDKPDDGDDVSHVSSSSDSILNTKRSVRREERRRSSGDDYEEQEEENSNTDDQSTTSGDDSSDDDESSTDRSATSQRSEASDDGGSSNSNNEHDDLDTFSAYNPLDPIFENQRREKEKKRKLRKRHARIRNSHDNVNANIFMSGGDGSGGTGEGDDASVMTGATGATGVHSLASQATTRVKNNGGGTGGDDVSVMTGATGATGMHSLASQATTRVKNNNAEEEDNMSAMTGATGTTRKVSNASSEMRKLPNIGENLD